MLSPSVGRYVVRPRALLRYRKLWYYIVLYNASAEFMFFLHLIFCILDVHSMEGPLVGGNGKRYFYLSAFHPFAPLCRVLLTALLCPTHWSFVQHIASTGH